MFTARSGWARRALVAALALCSALALFVPAAASARSQRTSSPIAFAARVMPRPLKLASIAARHDDSVLVADARALRRCVRAGGARHGRCRGARQALQRAGMRLALAERRLARLGGARVRGNASSAAWRNVRRAPRLYVAGHELEWARVAGMNSYVFVRKVPGQPDQYSVVYGTSLTPPPVPGKTVRYSLRTTAWGSAWASEVTITYPPVTTPAPAPEPDRQAAPQISVSGQTLSWNEVAAVTTYVLVRKVPGQPDQYSEVSGTSTTPPAVPGASVRYSVRTAVEGSAWASEVTIAYPSSSKPPSPSPPPPPPPPPAKEGSSGSGSEGGSSMRVALDIGGWAWPSAINDEAGAVKYFRSNYQHFSSDSQMELLANAGVTLMPLFGEGGTLAQYDNPGFVSEIVNWFKRYGKGGTFWAGRRADLGATTAELINEPGNPYFYPDYANAALYATMTKAVHAALEANFAPSVRPKLLVSYDGGFNGSAYGRAIFAAGAVADGVTVHPYGGHGSNSGLGGRERVTQAHEQTGLPVYVTEIGWPTAVGQPPTGDSLQWSEQQQAENISNFIGWARSLGYVADVTYFNYADYGSNNWYGIVNSSGTVHKLSYFALKAAAAGS